MDELKESPLGTQEYWNSRYNLELENFASHGDPGEVWFGEDIVERTIEWMRKSPISPNCKILDIGCGNGMFLMDLCHEGYTNLYGVDYCEGAIKLAQSISEKRGLKIQFSICNILEGLKGQFDVIHDKGTYDAISLNANIKEFRGKYLDNVLKSMYEEGIFILTSCNWTKAELVKQFKTHFVCVDNIPTAQFKFGGHTGGTVTSIIFKKQK